MLLDCGGNRRTQTNSKKTLTHRKAFGLTRESNPGLSLCEATVLTIKQLCHCNTLLELVCKHNHTYAMNQRLSSPSMVRLFTQPHHLSFFFGYFEKWYRFQPLAICNFIASTSIESIVLPEQMNRCNAFQRRGVLGTEWGLEEEEEQEGEEGAELWKWNGCRGHEGICMSAAGH